MAAHAAIALLAAALAWAASALAQDDPSCAQYREPMAYNACLARHGPRANNLGRLHGGTQPGQSAHDRAWRGGTRAGAPAGRFYRRQRPQRARGRVHAEFQVR
jgi:hypothetical protein